ncbi:MAG: galactokinase family protein [Clostridia bacterium]|nr:galactokinase family protein [Clostridia bacterium]
MEKQRLSERFSETFGTRAEFYAAAPGRTELGGNHTDHQHGRVLAAAVNLVTEAAVAKNDRREICVQSEGYPMVKISLDDLLPKAEEQGTTAALIRGVAARFVQMGYSIGGFDAVAASTVLPGSGLSSSAAFEVLIGTILNFLYAEGSVSAVEIAKIAQYAENMYFGKPCGLMDQMASSVGNVIGIDFADPENPVIERINFDFAASGYALCIIDSGADHADLTDEYAAIPRDMKAVAGLFGKEFLRDVQESEFLAMINVVRDVCGDRAVLRAMHFFAENKRVERQIAALQRGDLKAYLAEVTASGRSSWNLLQNVVPNGETRHQNMAIALAVAEKLLDGEGAYRVHGGGFAGTIQAFVPETRLEAFREGIERVLGEGSCHVLNVRPDGGVLSNL